MDETYVTMAGVWAYVYRAIDGQGQVVDVYVSDQRAAKDAASFFRRAVEATGVAPIEVRTDCAAAYPPALAAVLSWLIIHPRPLGWIKSHDRAAPGLRARGRVSPLADADREDARPTWRRCSAAYRRHSAASATRDPQRHIP